MQHYNALRLAMFSGKGGVGKTTLSCGFARYWAQQFPNERILLLSTDPAHSLGDILDMQVGDTPQTMADLPNLQVRALDAQRLLQVFKSHYGDVLELLVERGSFVQGDDLSPVWDLSWPGLDELMGILEIQQLLREETFGRIVVDMAPSGHTLNLFELMDFLESFIAALELFQEKHIVIKQSFTGRYTPDQADAFLSTMKADLLAGRNLLQDQQQTACLVVAIAQPMSFLETQRFISSLKTLKIPCGGILVNQIQSEIADAGLYYEQEEILGKFLAQTDQIPVFKVPHQSQEPVGGQALDTLMANVQEVHLGDTSTHPNAPLHVALPARIPPVLEDFVTLGRRLILLGGKGGVGKTTVAAAIAWGLAQRHPDVNIRVISIDPAHSLGDALDIPLKHEPTTLLDNLSGQEIDAETVLQQFREDYLWELAEMMSGDTHDSSLNVAYGPEAWRRIVAQALPGIDEMLSLLTVMECLENNKQDLVILDTAPTGHLLRFLAMPSALADWLAWIFKLWIKYQNVVGRTELMGRLRTLRQRVVQTQQKLKDPNYTEFVGVMQAQSAIIAETQRLTQSLEELGVSQRYIVHNLYEGRQDIPSNLFLQQTIVRLPVLPRTLSPLDLIRGASALIL